ncbi:MarR family transcriptional regulator [Rhizobium sp. NFR03]|uniref:MarR family transcriptional regulator n=1 Tax=Rhizobium sp. NFR03 TaxID=1566263 RepID=UPI0008BF9257|nr:MarR family transcriptional regulator [Rhizobium sp. NFR03]SES42307.1 hypothetical protein SAMN03159406_04249 [Rhizobium sp. NFR03]
MPSRFDSHWHSLSFAAMILREIMDNPLKNETASSRLKQIGLMSVLYYMHLANKKLTIANIIEETGLTRGGIWEAVDFLIQRKLLTETQIKNSLGRGRARQFDIPQTIFDKLRHFENT